MPRLDSIGRYLFAIAWVLGFGVLAVLRARSIAQAVRSGAIRRPVGETRYRATDPSGFWLMVWRQSFWLVVYVGLAVLMAVEALRAKAGTP
jgi:hypothetical protein